MSSGDRHPHGEYPHRVTKDRDAALWEDLAQREPYFAVLTTAGARGVDGNRFATEEFFETGEEDVTSLLAAIASLLGRDAVLTSTLDFGCGAGRLTLPLARRATNVVACDVAPTMLAHARRNAEDTGLRNVTFVLGDELAGLDDGRFDFVCSLLVLQYIPPTAGHELIRTLLRLLAPAGIAALHITFSRPGHALRRMARAMPGRSPDRRAPDQSRRKPYAQMTEYDERAVLRNIESCGAHAIARFATRHGDTAGAVLIIQKTAFLDLTREEDVSRGDAEPRSR